MATKSIDDHRSAINALLNNLAEIERLGNEFFFKAETSLSIPYPSQAAQSDAAQLALLLNTLENDARISGLLCLSASPPPVDDQPAERKNLQVRTQDATQARDALYKEKERLLKNLQTASASMAAAVGRGV